MSNATETRRVRVAIIGAGAVSDYHHVPALRLDPRSELVAVCDADPALLEKRKGDWGVDLATTDAPALCASPDIDAVIIATPNFTHKPIALAAVRAGKHVMCEKPLGLNAGEVREMYVAARDAGVVHMTAFTYRFAPSMRYLRHLLKGGALGTPRHFRSQRFLDWPETSWGWRQYKAKAGAGDLYDMTIHRIDFALDLLGPLIAVCGAVARFAPRTQTPDGRTCPPSDVDDWSCLIGEFACGATGVWEGTTLAKGYGRNGFGHEWAEVNGSEGSAVYRLHEPNTILLGQTGQDLAPHPVPAEFLKPAGSPRDPSQGEPATIFRYDLVWEFISAIVEKRPAVPSFYDGLNAPRSWSMPCWSRTPGGRGSKRPWPRLDQVSAAPLVRGGESLPRSSPRSARRFAMTLRLPHVLLMLVAPVSSFLYLGLAVWGWGDWRSFLGHPVRVGVCVLTVVLAVASVFSGCALFSRGKREDTKDRWIFVPMILIALALAWLPPYADRRDLWSLDGDAVRYLGLAFFAVGGVLRVGTMFALGRLFSGLVAIQEGHTLVTTGLYRRVRHPSYLGALLGTAGWVLAFRSGIGLLMTLLMVPLIVARMDAEEVLLLSEFGEEYAAYRRRTWRLLPFVY